jgi:hypothetical protein
MAAAHAEPILLTRRRPTSNSGLRGVAKVYQFGEFMVERRIVNRQELLAALMAQDHNPGVPLGEVVAAMGYAEPAEVESALEAFMSLEVVEL